MNLETRVRLLENRISDGYQAYGSGGRATIESDLGAPDWYMWAVGLFQSGSCTAKEELRAALARTVGNDNCGGRLYELVAALAAGCDSVTPSGLKLS